MNSDLDYNVPLIRFECPPHFVLRVRNHMRKSIIYKHLTYSTVLSSILLWVRWILDAIINDCTLKEALTRHVSFLDALVLSSIFLLITFRHLYNAPRVRFLGKWYLLLDYGMRAGDDLIVTSWICNEPVRPFPI